MPLFLTDSVTMSQISLEKLLDIMEAKDKRLVDEIGGLQVISKNLGSDLEKGLFLVQVSVFLVQVSDRDFDQRKQKYGTNQMERKPPPSIFELFMDAMKDTTIIVLLVTA